MIKSSTNCSSYICFLIDVKKEQNLWIPSIFWNFLLTCCSWALVKDQEVARKMTEFIEINTIGVSKDSQLRAAKILQAVADSCDLVGTGPEEVQPFFDHSYILMEKRWNQLRAVVEKSRLFSLPNFSAARCNFSGRNFKTQPGNCKYWEVPSLLRPSPICTFLFYQI